ATGATGAVSSVVSTGATGVMLALVSVPGSVMSVIAPVVSGVIMSVASGVTGSTGVATHSAPLGDTRLRQKLKSRSSSLCPATMIAITLIGSNAYASPSSSLQHAVLNSVHS